ncbi:GTP-binding protein ypt1 [Trichinella pseudospiralis]|uniref:GTP-binding protein ypt1 n=1 Tax=Trichinella pseudospiralis TaxID=6337 RepID=A0A0V1DV37_TRIPS|nr:GTP-binding protein ypt1 [Trichinella pseudospiralis]
MEYIKMLHQLKYLTKANSFVILCLLLVELFNVDMKLTSDEKIDVRVSFSLQCSAVLVVRVVVVVVIVELTMTTQARQQVYKLVLCGDYGVGKSSLFRRFVFDTFVESSDRKCTLGFDHYEKTYPIEDKSVTLQLWDTGGLERVATVTSSYFKFSNGVLLVFAYDDMDSLNDLSQHLVEALSCAEQARYFLCGNKADLYNDDGYGPNEENVNLFCQQSSGGGGGSLFSRVYKVSCKTNENIHQMFEDIARQLVAHGCHSAAPDPEMFRLKAVDPSSSSSFLTAARPVSLPGNDDELLCLRRDASVATPRGPFARVSCYLSGGFDSVVVRDHCRRSTEQQPTVQRRKCLKKLAERENIVGKFNSTTMTVDVHEDPVRVVRRARVCSAAFCFHSLSSTFAVLFPLVIVLKYGNWCRHSSTLALQRSVVTFGGEFFVLLASQSSNSSGEHLFWSSEERFNRRDQSHARPAWVETAEIDHDGDGLPDEMQFNAAVPLHNGQETVHSAKLWLVFNRLLRSDGVCEVDEDVLLMLDGGGTVGNRWIVSGRLRTTVGPSSPSACEELGKAGHAPLGRLLLTNSDKSPLDMTVSEIEAQLFTVATLLPSNVRWLWSSDPGDQFRVNVTVAYVEEPSRLVASSFENVSKAWTQYFTLFVPVLILVKFVRRLVYKNNLLTTIVAEENKL